MYEIKLFWILTLIFSLMALCFVLPWVRLQTKMWTCFFRMTFVVFIPCVAYGYYHYWGASQALPIYYSEAAQNARKNAVYVRALLSNLSKKEFLLHLKLEENPNDVEARWNLLNVMGIEAYQKAEYERAIGFWHEALTLIPVVPKHNMLRGMIERLIINAHAKL